VYDLQHFVGKTIGKCVLQRPLKVGGQGTSYLAYDEELDRKRVVKIARIGLSTAGDPESQASEANFRQEGYLLSRLRHPQIVPVLEQGTWQGYRYMILDYIEGFDFNKVFRILRQQQKNLNCQWEQLLDLGTALSVLYSALQPLVYTHSVKIQLPGEGLVEGIAHRDISSGNLMLGKGHEHGGQVHLIDFGIAKTNYHHSMTVNTKVMGTIQYMSPMRLFPRSNRNGSVFWDHFQQTQYDIHSLGCFFLELLTGTGFVEEDDFAQNLAKIQNPISYQDLYIETKARFKSVYPLIRRSIVHPELEDGKGFSPFKTAPEMLVEVKRLLALHLGSEAAYQQSLQALADCIENPEDMVKVVSEGKSRVVHLSGLQPVLVRQKKYWLPWALGIGIVIVMIGLGLSLYSGLLQKGLLRLNHKIIHLTTPEGEMPPHQALEIQKNMSTLSPPTNSTLTQNNPSKTSSDSLSSIQTQAGQSSALSGSFRLSNTFSTESQTRNEQFKGPAGNSTYSREPSSGKDVSALKPLSTAQESLLVIENSLAKGDDETAYKWVSALQKGHEDAALLILQAHLILRRNPTSLKARQLLRQVEASRPSLFWSQSRLRRARDEIQSMYPDSLPSTSSIR